MQVNLLKSVLPDGAKVGTVDKFQGQDVTTAEGQEARRARAPDSPVPGECMDARTARPSENGR